MANAGDRDMVESAIRAFYVAFDDGFTQPAEYATDDWYHINPFGGVDAGRGATLATVRRVHETFLRGVTDTPDTIDIRFATPDVAVGTVTSTMSAWTDPNGTQMPASAYVRTFVVVKRADRWLIMQDQNTAVARRG